MHSGDHVEDDELGVGGRGPSLSWPQLVVLVAAFAFLAGAAVYFFENRESSPSAVDAGFYQDMIFHHEQAVEMSLIELENGSDPTVRSFAQEIVIFQEYEIGRMDARLRQWGLDRLDADDTSMSWMGDGMRTGDMPGLASEEQLDGLRAAEGAAADVRFLELMAEHHRAGADMAHYAAEHADDDDVRSLARLIARNQAVEIVEFARTAERLGFDVDIPPYEPGTHAGH